MIPYSNLVELSNNFGLDFSLIYSHEDSLGLSNHHHPWSIREQEAKIIYETILNNNIKFAFEIATAFGISASVIGQALKSTKGRLLTMDAYIEEKFNHAGHYDINTKLVSDENADGYRMAKKLIEVLNLNDYINIEIGWSPSDVYSLLIKTFGENKLDFAFIDGGHSQMQIYADLNAVLPFMANDSIILLHDHTEVPYFALDLLKNSGFTTVKNYNTGFNLWGYSRGDKTL
jgi:predicted O-methyltransferase YrrM